MDWFLFDEAIMMMTVIFIIRRIQQNAGQKRRPKRRPIRKLYLQRDLVGAHQRLLEQNLVSYTEFVRMDKTNFEWLLSLVGPRIEKQTTNMKKPISAATRLSLTLRFLATGK